MYNPLPDVISILWTLLALLAGIFIGICIGSLSNEHTYWSGWNNGVEDVLIVLKEMRGE